MYDATRGECVLVSFPYNEKLIQIIKTVPGAIWAPQFKCWEIRKCMCKVLVYSVKRYRAQIQEEVSWHIENGLFESDNSIFDMSAVPALETTPFNYQIDGIKYGVKNKRFILGDEPGCLSGETEICVRHSGKPETRYIKLKSLFTECLQSSEYLSTVEVKVLANGRFAYLPVEDVVYSGVQKTLRVITENSSISLTPDHLVLTDNGWKPAGQLTTDDYIICDGVEASCETNADLHKNIDSNKYVYSDTCAHNLSQSSMEYVVKNGVKIYYVPQKVKVKHLVECELEPVYDIKICGEIHNFVANKLVVHNCGKTLQIIGLHHYLRHTQNHQKTLVICGINGNKYNWLEEVQKHSKYKAHVIGSRIGKRSGKINPGGIAETIEDLRNPPDADFYIMNVERLRGARVPRKRGQRKTIKEFPIAELIQNLINRGIIGLVAFDEIHKCKSPTAAQAQALLWIKCDRQVAMTGTLIMNSPLDLYIPFSWMGWEFRDYWSFQNKYTVKDTWGSIIGYQNAQELIDVLQVYQLRRLKAEVLDQLPDKVPITKYVEMSAKEWKCYNAIQMGLFNMLQGEETNPTDLKTGLFQITPQSLDPMTMSLRLRQCTAHTSIISDRIIESSKMDMMEDIIEEELSVVNAKGLDGKLYDGKVIIFSNWTTVTNIVRNRLAKYNPAYITGEVNDAIKNEERLRFQTDPNCRIIIGTIPAMGTGYTLDAATAVIFLDEPWTKATKTQAEDRAHRASSKHSVNIYTLLAKDTIDEHVHEVVEDKGDLSDLIVDGIVNPNKKMQMFKILVGADRWNKVAKEVF